MMEPFRVPVFRSNSDAMKGGPSTSKMLVFRPVVLDETSLKDLAEMNPTGPSHFWLVTGDCKSQPRSPR